MNLYPLRTGLPDLADVVARGEVSRVWREPRTAQQVLAGISEQMDAEDEALARARDPVAWLRAERRKRSLFWRLFG